MTSLTASSDDLTALSVDAVIVGVAKTEAGPVLVPGAEALDAALGGDLARALAAVGATGAEDEVTRLATFGRTSAPTIVAVGLGTAAERYPHETLRRAAGLAARTLAGCGSAATSLALANGDPGDSELRAVAEGLLLGAYAFRRYRSQASAEQAREPLAAATVAVPAGAEPGAGKVLERAGVVAEAVALCRDLVNTPPGDLHPADLAQAAVDACTPLGLDVQVLDEHALAEGGYGGLLGVGSGSTHPPRLVRIAYTAPGATRTVAIAGKGITFDSGGLSLKPAAAMEWMKSDMGGAAAVIAAMTAVARLRPDVNVTGWVPTAENMPSGSAIRPSDVLTIHGGKTVEVLNTDAEGRLVLADALVRACEEHPDVVVDVATLTGAQLVALGSHTFAVMANDDDLRAELVAAAGDAGELAWPMPLPKELRGSLDSDVADIANMGDRYGGMLVAGLFLREFVAEGVRWAHLDIAGPAYNQGEPYGYTPKGGTGAAVRTLVELLERAAG